jgi:predicted AAA+ superfamily ATPase
MPQHADEHNKEILKENILFFQQNFQPHWIERELRLPLNTNKIITIIGPRRVGKTHILLQLPMAV